MGREGVCWAEEKRQGGEGVGEWGGGERDRRFLNPIVGQAPLGKRLDPPIPADPPTVGCYRRPAAGKADSEVRDLPGPPGGGQAGVAPHVWVGSSDSEATRPGWGPHRAPVHCRSLQL